VSSTATAHRLLAVGLRSAALLDIAMAAAAFVATLAQLSHGGFGLPRFGPRPPGHGDIDALGAVLAACSTLPLLAWRRFPLGVFAATTAAGAVLAVLDRPRDLMLGPVVALYLLAASRGRHPPWTWRRPALVAGLLVAYLGAAAVARGAFPTTVLSHSGLAWAVAWFAGERTRLRQEHVAEVTERAQRAERDAQRAERDAQRAERDAERERLLAAAEERARIARDLHDSAGHAISVIAVRAGAARLRHHQDTDRSLAALEAIEELARHTVDEIDQLVGALRDEGAPTGAVGLALLDLLIARHAAAGLEVTLVASGTPRPPGAAADQAAYRLLQEALTNAARHGAGSARIELAYGDTQVELTVTNPVPAGRAPRPGGGHGMIGMRERVTLLGGGLHAERANGTFRVRARIPYGGHPG